MHTLTDDQRRLVRDNLGLVGVHLRRHVRGLDAPRRHREWEDLFQEGCLGLMRAAVAFDPARGIPFAAFALPRIHNAVSCALEEKFSMFASPKRRRRRPGGADSKRSTRPDRSPRIRSLSDLPIQYSRSRRQNPTERPAGETVVARLQPARPASRE